MIKNIVFDIGNVIAYIDYFEAMDHLFQNKEDKKFIYDNVLNSPEWSKYSLIDMGYLSIDDITNIIGDRFDNVNDDIIRKFMHEHYNYLNVNKDVINLIQSLREKNYKVYLLSNINDKGHEVYKQSGLFNYVDGYVLSYEEHKVKPHLGIYKTFIEKYSIDPNESIFIDDKIENCIAAEKVGLRYINVLPNNYQDLVAKLKEKDIID